MQALIIAGGLGKRMGIMTQDKPKCLVKVGNKTILGYILDRFLQVGIKKIIITISKWHNQIEKYILQNYPNLDIKLVNLPRKGVGYSVYASRNYLNFNENLLITMSDLICFDGYNSICDALLESDLAIAVSDTALLRDKNYSWAYLKDEKLYYNLDKNNKKSKCLIGLYAIRANVLEEFYQNLSLIETAEKGELSLNKMKEIQTEKREYRLGFAFLGLINSSDKKATLLRMNNSYEINKPEHIILANKHRLRFSTTFTAIV